MNPKKIFQCEVCNIRVEDWVTVELDPDDVHQIDMQFSYCPKCGTPLGKKLYLNRREQALNSIYAVSGADTCDSIRGNGFRHHCPASERTVLFAEKSL